MSTPYLFQSPPETSVPEPAEGRQGIGRGNAKLQLCVLGSGSGGNSSVVRLGDRAILLDAGFGPVTTARRLSQAGMTLSDIDAICVTHLDRDHFRDNWARTLTGYRIPVYVHRWHADRLAKHGAYDQLEAAGLVRLFGDAPFTPAPGFTLDTVALAHDTKGTFAYHVQTSAGCLGYATDMGHAPDALVSRFAGVDLLAVESNYDPPMQMGSNRPLFLKRRVMGQAGHLSNQQAYELVCRIASRSASGNPRHVVLLHRSQQCNHPKLIHEVFAQSPDLHKRIALTEQRRRSKWFTITPQPVVEHAQLAFKF